MKKIACLSLALALTLALCLPAFAAGKTKTVESNDGKKISFSNVTLETETSLTEIAKWISLSADEISFMKDYYGDKIQTFHCDAPTVISAKEGVAGMQWRWDSSVSEKSVTHTLKKDTTKNYDWFAGELKLTASGHYLIWIHSHKTGASPFYLVIGGDESTTSTKQKPSDSTEKTTTRKPSAPSTPTSEKTVRVAGTDRTPGQIQALRSGDYLYTVASGDTLYDITARFYGNGNLWKELQKANQENLNATKDGIIFVGFNLILPAELGGVRANA